MTLKTLSEGSTIGVIAPAFPPDAQKLAKGLQYLKNLGYNIKEGKSLTARHLYFAGSDQLRIAEIEAMFADPKVDAIFCARGGWGTLRLLDKLNYDLIRQNPKVLVGYSDVTTLQLAIYQMTEIPSLSGPMVAVEMGNGILDFTEKHFWDQIQNPEPWYSFVFRDEDVETWSEGEARGLLTGGCLSMLAHQLGTPFMPDLTGAILFLEDVGESPYKIDRYLAQLYQAGIFKK
ncbi:MAG: LD-carboxypeptidase, partial [Calditrichaeota bacterium]|nr:LD-carboxypeptidase [Calditrichota bacterium]